MTETLNSRSEILARIRSAIGRERSPQNAEDAWQAIPRHYRQSSALAPAGCIDLLSERLRDYGAGVHPSQPAQVALTVADILRHRNKKRVLVSPDIDPAWLPEGEWTFVHDGMMSYDDMDNCDGVMTGAAVAIAATGTLGLCHGGGGDPSPGNAGLSTSPSLRSGSGRDDRLSGDPGEQLGQGRRATTLIPDYHLCIVRASDVVETVPEAMSVLEKYKRQPITLVSGPSATADIEMTRIQGVHGPRTLDVVIVV